MQVFAALEQSASSQGSLRGVLLWMLASADYPDWDGYTLYPGGGEPSECLATAQAWVGRMQAWQPRGSYAHIMAVCLCPLCAAFCLGGRQKPLFKNA